MPSNTGLIQPRYDVAGAYREWSTERCSLAELKNHNLTVRARQDMLPNDECSLCGLPFQHQPNTPWVCSLCATLLQVLRQNGYFRRLESYAANKRKQEQADFLNWRAQDAQRFAGYETGEVEPDVEDDED